MKTALVCSGAAKSCCHSNRHAVRRPAVVPRALVTRPAQQRSRSLRVRAQADPHAGHAKLHDFCMTIPYGGIALLSGVLALVFKAPAVGLQLVGAGVVISLCSLLSIKAWKGRSSSTPYTLVCAGSSGWIAYQMWQRVQASVAPVPSGILLALSAALAVFCVYNIIAGGNPPPAQKAPAA
ncbi:hypothetical protein OEZ85_006965 [Tetradesmus obliquus]|uniref:Uncharacterized protein n=2 Tax=Tetradesmus obliquus TaxID=3088 RepID=A0ABY8TWP6_TETOB|nr:hypothetical protein OEZ85_006965 [Tetradesmus obliquus]